ncbi:MAG TPA: ABC transporter ATP-binding protein [Hypericibacter adhaerens]|jgi:ATP-binding cassette subfamily B multidrug efflux pump|uniref:ABC transporter ATP-binding protein n=1 Tax=Hypericibacter adhaerens TaxID=2602016 RepID=UPI002B754384|nr:ABC transporter ATP-binding protein [Hypericibacter adhaerens]HWA45532.1 ABC transporter ATP-binding protein [Hypericibacter adhaerens]
MSLFRFFEKLLQPTAAVTEAAPPPGLAAFYWFYVRQVRGLVVALFLTGIAVAGLDTTIPIFIGRIVALISSHSYETFFAAAWPQLVLMGVVLLVARPVALLLQNLVTNQAIAPGLTNLIRWQSHWHVVRQSWTFFQNDFAGRIANRIMQTGPALRESVVASTNAVLYILVYGGTALVVLASHDWRLSIPVFFWFVGYVILLRICVPRMRNRSREMSEVRSALTGRVVDSYTNILTVKLFARPRDEDDFVREAVDEHTRTFHRQQRLITIFSMSLISLNILMVVGTAAMAMWLWSMELIEVGIVAMAIPLAWQIANIAGWVAQNVTAIFENVGVVQDGMKSIAVPLQMPDRPNAGTLEVTQGHVQFENVHFGYGTTRGVLHGIDLDIKPGERVGLVGQSGAGKSTLVNLLLHFYDVEQGRILIDGQDIAGVTQESLRAHISMVTQDTSLLHRSILDNIRYGKPQASMAEAREAAAKAHALDFIETLEDWQGRRGFDAHVGERGVKLSGGQRQRIAIARVILKNAPILVLDEATSALDSEVEAAIQEQLEGLMKGRTVIAIAHRLSTIARMDRLVVLDRGRIVEQGSHNQLLELGGAYAKLWLRQSGGFGAGILKDGEMAEAAEAPPEEGEEPYSPESRPLEAVRAWERR